MIFTTAWRLVTDSSSLTQMFKLRQKPPYDNYLLANEKIRFQQTAGVHTERSLSPSYVHFCQVLDPTRNKSIVP